MWNHEQIFIRCKILPIEAAQKKSWSINLASPIARTKIWQRKQHNQGSRSIFHRIALRAHCEPERSYYCDKKKSVHHEAHRQCLLDRGQSSEQLSGNGPTNV